MKTFPLVYDSGEITGANNPATADFDNGVILINKKIWDKFTKWEKVFILEHEKGHLTLQTECEELADNYAISKTYRVNKDAFKDALSALKKVASDKNRIDNIYYLLFNQNLLNNTEMNFKKNTSTDPIMKQQEEHRSEKRPVKKNFNGKKGRRNFDGTTNTSHKINGITVGGVYFSMTNILLALILLVVTVQTIKK